jgi:hypothetical protein
MFALLARFHEWRRQRALRRAYKRAEKIARTVFPDQKGVVLFFSGED